MIPEILHSKKIDNRLILELWPSSVLVCGYSFGLADVEMSNTDSIEMSVLNTIRLLPANILVRFKYVKRLLTKAIVAENTRAQAICSRESYVHVGYIFFEFKTNMFKNSLSLFGKGSEEGSFHRSALDFISELDKLPLANLGLELSPLSDVEHYKPFLEFDECARRDKSLFIGNDFVGVLKLQKQTEHALNELIWAKRKDLPFEYEYTLSFKSKSLGASELLLRHTMQTKSAPTTAKDVQDFHSANRTFLNLANGSSLLIIEAHIVIRAADQSRLKQMCELATQAYWPMGNFARQTFGERESFQASLVGCDQHCPLLESDCVTVSMLPLFTFGYSEPQVVSDINQLLATQKVSAPQTLFLHRKDRSIERFNLYDPSYEAFSACIVGMSGSGKSVLTNLITRALHNNPNAYICKLDVGGSHSRETALLGGEEIDFAMDRPSQFNPFMMLKRHPSDTRLRHILGSFVSTLLLELGEVELSKEMRSDVEQAISYYANVLTRPSLTDFYHQVKDRLPRPKLLHRWTTEGVFSSAFSSTQVETESTSRLRYFNFSQIAQAQDGDYAQGGLAAVMLDYVYQAIFNKKNRQFVFIADEVPMFIKRNYDFFASSIKNVRKEGGAFIIVAQSTSDLILAGKDDIVREIKSRFIFNRDGNDDVWREYFNFEDHDIEEIKNLKRVQGEYSEVFLSDKHGGRRLRIELSPEEYWAVTSKKEDKDKIEILLKMNFTLKEAIRCLSYR